MHFNLTPLIIISRTSRFSLLGCPSQDKHNLFAIKPNKYVCAGDRKRLGRALLRGRCLARCGQGPFCVLGLFSGLRPGSRVQMKTQNCLVH